MTLTAIYLWQEDSLICRWHSGCTIASPSGNSKPRYSIDSSEFAIAEISSRNQGEAVFEVTVNVWKLISKEVARWPANREGVEMKANCLRTVQLFPLALLLVLSCVHLTFADPLDENQPAFRFAYSNPGPPFSIGVSVIDSGGGLKSIDAVDAINATVSIPPFIPGITSPVTVAVTRIDQSQNLAVTLEAVDMAGNVCLYTYPEPVVDDPDVIPPVCRFFSEDPGPPTTARFMIQDTGSGLESIDAIEAANVTVSIPPFSPGIKSPVYVTATKIDQNIALRLSLTSLDVEGNETICRYPSGDDLFDARPEFDAVGQDCSNIFGDYFTTRVIEKGLDENGYRCNEFSDFAEAEYFTTTAGQSYRDPCFSTLQKEYLSALVPTWTEAVFQWQIVLQMEPASDIQLNIAHCVMRTQEVDPWRGAEQTGRYRATWGELFFIPNANPAVTVLALPGPNATPGFPQSGFYMDARNLPGLDFVPLVDAPGTGETLSSESIVMALYDTGRTNASGQTTYALKQGDRIHVTVRVPANNSCHVRYGRDNVVLKYIGVLDTEYTTR
jgi:hypothetical protein